MDHHDLNRLGIIVDDRLRDLAGFGLRRTAHLRPLLL
jgi:hypothetical protein